MRNTFNLRADVEFIVLSSYIMRKRLVAELKEY